MSAADPLYGDADAVVGVAVADGAEDRHVDDAHLLALDAEHAHGLGLLLPALDHGAAGHHIARADLPQDLLAGAAPGVGEGGAHEIGAEGADQTGLSLRRGLLLGSLGKGFGALVAGLGGLGGGGLDLDLAGGQKQDKGGQDQRDPQANEQDMVAEAVLDHQVHQLLHALAIHPEVRGDIIGQGNGGQHSQSQARQ